MVASRRNSFVGNDLETKVDLNEYPEILNEETANHFKHFTIGDMHANAMKLIHFLITCRIIEATPEQYSTLNQSYKILEMNTSKSSSDEALKIFKDTLNECKLIDKTKLIRLLGDNLADRGARDELILLILEFLAEANIEIVLSNHDLEFLTHYENGFKHFSPEISPASAVSLARFVDHYNRTDNETRQYYNHIIETHYLPRLKLLTYSLQEGGRTINLYPHAPICLKTVVKLADSLSVDLSDLNIYDTTIDLAHAIYRINLAFQDSVKSKRFHTLVNIGASGAGQGYSHVSTEFPLERLVWNRIITDTDIAENKKANYKITFNHGHTETVNQENYTSYDNILGKSAFYTSGVLQLRMTANLTLASTEEVNHFYKKMKIMLDGAITPKQSEFKENPADFRKTGVRNKIKEPTLPPAQSMILPPVRIVPSFKDGLKTFMKNKWVIGFGVVTLGVGFLFAAVGYSLKYAFTKRNTDTHKPRINRTANSSMHRISNLGPSVMTASHHPRNAIPQQEINAILDQPVYQPQKESTSCFKKYVH